MSIRYAVVELFGVVDVDPRVDQRVKSFDVDEVMLD